MDMFLSDGLHNPGQIKVGGGGAGGAVVSTVASQQEGPRFCGEFACSPHVLLCSLQVLQLLPTSSLQRHASGFRLIHSKLPMSVNVSICGCLSLSSL